MPMRSKTTITLSDAVLEQLTLVRDYLVHSARRCPSRANPALLRPQVGLGIAVDELCRRYFRDMERQQKASLKAHDTRRYTRDEIDRQIIEEEEAARERGEIE